MVRENWKTRMEMLRHLPRVTVRGEALPSVREVGEAVSLCVARRPPTGTSRNLKKLEEAGYVERDGRKVRGLKLTDKGWEAAGGMPLLARIIHEPFRRVCCVQREGDE